MAIGGIYLMDAADTPADFGYVSWHELVAGRLQCSPVFRQRLVEVPWSLSHPVWINDPEFDLDAHLPRLALASPGGKKELMELAAEIWSRTLNRERPLWDLTLVEGVNRYPGLSPGSWALITRAHHASVDGGAATEMMTALLDQSPRIRRVDTEDTWEPEAFPSTVGLISRSWGNIGNKAVELAGFAGKVISGTARLRSDKRIRKLNPPPRLMSAPRSIFNGPVNSRRVYWATDFDFQRVRALRPHVPGATVNDVILAVCAGGLRQYLLEKEQLPEKPLVAMAPISVRQEDAMQTGGNQVSAMLVDLATDVEEPLLRLRRIHLNTQGSKIHANALPANQITEFIPSETLAAAARVYTRTRLGAQHRPFFNVTITNVPGPPFPLYLAGARIRHSFGMAPIIDGLGLLLVVFSYAGRISIGITSCHDMVPDPERLAACFEESLEELEQAASETDAIPGEAEEDGTTSAADDSNDPLAEFHKAERALDAAIQSLTEKNRNEPT
jgi:WS/DGAT/MGAT family acyltransferase